MPSMSSVVRFNKIPSTGFVPETSGTAPTSPVIGQLWVDSSVTPKLLKVWDGSLWAITNIYSGTTAGTFADGAAAEFKSNKGIANGYASLDAGVKIPYAQIPTGTSVNTIAAGDDARLTGAVQSSTKNAANGVAGLDASSRILPAQLPSVITAAGQTGATTTVRFVGGTGAAAAPASGTFNTGDVVVGTDGSVYVCTAGGTPGTWRRSLRDNELGAANGIATLNGSSQVPFAQVPTAASGASTANTVVIATDSRLNDSRNPNALSVTDASVATNAAIAESKLNLASDAATGTASRRTLGYTGLSAMPGVARLDQIAVPTASVSLNSQTITNLGAPVSANDAARLIDIQNSAAGIDSKPSVRALATTNVATLSGAQTIDGVSLVAGDRVLLAGQTTASQNGAYVVAAGAWTRATDGINPNSTWFVEEGTANRDTAWWVTNDGVVTVGTTALVISQFSGGVSYTAGTGITLTAGQISISSSYAGQASIVTVGTLTTGALGTGFSAVGLAQGGLGVDASSTAGKLTARTNINAPQRGYAADLGAIVAGTPFVVTHNLGTQDVIAQVRDSSTNEIVYLDIINASTSTVTVTSGLAYSAAALRIVVLPVA